MLQRCWPAASPRKDLGRTGVEGPVEAVALVAGSGAAIPLAASPPSRPMAVRIGNHDNSSSSNHSVHQDNNSSSSSPHQDNSSRLSVRVLHHPTHLPRASGASQAPVRRPAWRTVPHVMRGYRSAQATGRCTRPAFGTAASC
jgi:hypothetical protein